MKKELSRTETAVRNSTVSIISKLILIFLEFFARTVFLKYLDISLMGVSSTFSSVLKTLSLAELGFEGAIVFTLYKPLADNDQNLVNDTINVLKRIYQAIGTLFIVAGIGCLPILPYILKGVEVTWYIRFIFLIQVTNSASSYFLAYKRSLLYADKRGYITTVIDTVANMVIEAAKIAVVIITKEYLIYVALTTIQTILTNVIVHIVCGKIYPYLHNAPFNVNIFKRIWGMVKNLFVSKIAYYVYASTDNLVISSLISAVSVGYISNYTMIITSLKSLATSVIGPVTPIIGNLLASDKSEKHTEEILRVYTFVRFVIAAMVVIPLIILVQGFITWCFGEQYLLPLVLIVFYAMDLYVHLVHSALCDYINGSGLFKEERNVEIVGAICNLVLSIVLALIMRNISPEMGILGVLIGTIVSQAVFWIYRSIIAYRHCFKSVNKGLVKYWLRNIMYIIFTVALTILLSLLYKTVNIDFFILKFFVCGLISEAIIVALICALFGKTEEFGYIKEIVLKKFKSLRKR